MGDSKEQSHPEPYQPKRGWVAKFANALRGIVVGCFWQSSFWVHGLAALAVAGLGIYLRLSTHEWCIVLLCVAVVFGLELMNSSIEKLAKAVTRQENPDIRDALDMAAGAVLIAAGASAVVGLVIFVPKLIGMFGAR